MVKFNNSRVSSRRGRLVMDGPVFRSRAITLVEMLIAMAITLLMMAAVVTLFANISGSVSRRRATVEMSTQMQQVRAMLQRDLAGATCPAVPWQRPESNHGYIEIIEGAQSDTNPSQWITDSDNDGIGDGLGPNLPGVDLTVSSLPSSNLISADKNTDGRGLGDGDDILMFTVRNEKEPFVGRAPTGVYRSGTTDNTPGPFERWGYNSIESQLAEVVWYALENPSSGTTPDTFYFGEPGFRTIYRRALLIAPQLNFSFRISSSGNEVITGPGVLRVLDSDIRLDQTDRALAALIAFQERYDISARVEWDPLLPGSNNGRWKIVANTLGDLTKRENRYEHHGWGEDVDAANITLRAERKYPFALASIGSGYTSTNLSLIVDGEYNTPSNQPNADVVLANGGVVATTITTPLLPDRTDRYDIRPFVRATANNSPVPFALRAIIDENGSLVYLTRGIAPLGNARRGEDVVMSDALAFDLRVYDPGAPLYEYNPTPASNQPALTVVQPGDPAWLGAYKLDIDFTGTKTNDVGNLTATTALPFAYSGQGAYVDLGFGYDPSLTPPIRLELNRYLPALNAVRPLFFYARALSNNYPDRFATQLAPGYSVYDTWSFHYENNGVNEDGDYQDLDGDNSYDAPSEDIIDEGTNGFDDLGLYLHPNGADDNNNGSIDENAEANLMVPQRIRGVDDPSERETTPPYDTSLRGLQVTLRGYERDSRQLREVKVRQTFVPK